MNNTEKNKRIGILIIHGFAGSRDEIRTLHEYLSKEKYDIEMPLLTGHEATKENLAKAHFKDWLLDVEESYIKLSKRCEKIVVIGFSMGGLLAVNLYKYKPIALITVNTPIYYWNIKIILENFIYSPSTYLVKYINACNSKPVSALLQFQRLLTKTKPLFKIIYCNVLVIQTVDDDTVHFKSADYIYDRLKGSKELLKLSKGGHIVFNSDSCFRVCSIIDNYLLQFL
ncbi:alpha/beta hydrolase [Anaerovorax odorimutans]|uniref:alpha/beta hydrolase n=1 Tax=Anaerovorax odorimutans TaxID=109327 RepID=UPI0003F7164A|nr:alpha/beta fold hydrolase [Anaerovorax odorimutans]